ncbi:MAG: tetratricopeptide repeat protein [Bryobacteraceae bacterium]
MILAAAAALAQQGGAQGGGNAGGAAGGGLGGGTTGGGRGGTSIPTTPGNIPGRQTTNPNDPSNRGQFPEYQRPPIFLSGKVMMEDGTPPPEPVVIERICNGNPRPEGYTDSKGRFSFSLGQNTHMMADASVSSNGDVFDQTPGIGGSRQTTGLGSPMGGMGGRQITERDLMGCDIRAALPGYRSDTVSLAGRRSLDNPDVGTIILRRLAGVEGFATSMTTLQAPKEAKKAFEKSRELAKKNKTAEAQKELEKAVAAYPNYALAWFTLGEMYRSNKNNAEAKNAYEQALKADRRYTNPYLPLAQLAAAENKWEDAADISGRLLKLNPIEYPFGHYINSIANYNLQKYDDAEKSAREVVKLDTRHQMPKAQHILGILLAMKDDYQGAVENIKGYLQFAPDAQDAEQVRKQLADFEKRLQASAGDAPKTQQQ